MTTLTEPDTRPDTTTSNDISHAVCIVCYPDCPQPDMQSLCGHPIDVEKQYEGVHCAVCEDLIPDHMLSHVYRGEFPR